MKDTSNNPEKLARYGRLCLEFERRILLRRSTGFCKDLSLAWVGFSFAHTPAHTWTCANPSRIRDTHGHQTGDKVLQEFVILTRDALRPSDLLARHGGEEFVILLPDTARKQAAQLAERLRKIIETKQFTVDPGAPPACLPGNPACEGRFAAQSAKPLLSGRPSRPF